MELKDNKTLIFLGIAGVGYFFYNKNKSDYKAELYEGKWFEIPNYDKNPIPGPALPQVLPGLGFYYFSGFGDSDGWYHKIDLEEAGWKLIGKKWWPPQDAANGANNLAAITNVLSTVVDSGLIEDIVGGSDD